MSDLSTSSESSSAPDETPAPTIQSTLRALIAAFVASLNTHCNAKGKPEAETAVSTAKAQIGDELTPKEHAHLSDVFAKLQEHPAPISPVPAAPDPSDTSEPDAIPVRQSYGRINTGAPSAPSPVPTPIPSEPTFNNLPANDPESSESSNQPSETELAPAPIGAA